MPQLILLAADLVAITLLVALYVHRHRRRDLVGAYLGVNVGVLAVAWSLSSGTIGAGLGLGLFGVLSIIRLRSTELDQHEVAYYFAALALGIIGPVGGSTLWHAPALMALILLAMLVGDHPRLMRGYRRQTLVLDSAMTDPWALRSYLEQLLGAKVHSASVQRIDLVDDTTTVEVRYEIVEDRRAPDPARVSSRASRDDRFAGVGGVR